MSRLKMKIVNRLIKKGAIAQLGERLHGMQEVRGSIPLGSTNKQILREAYIGCERWSVNSQIRTEFAKQ